MNLLMLMAVAGTLAMREWLDGCLIVYVFSIAELLLQVCYYKVEKSLSGEIKLSPLDNDSFFYHPNWPSARFVVESFNSRFSVPAS